MDVPSCQKDKGGSGKRTYDLEFYEFLTSTILAPCCGPELARHPKIGLETIGEEPPAG